MSVRLRCKWCDRVVTRKAKAGPHPEYCGAACRDKANAARQRAQRKESGCPICGAPTELGHVYCGPCAQTSTRLGRMKKLGVQVEPPMQTRLLNPDAPTLRHEDWEAPNVRTRPCIDCGATVHGGQRGAVASRCPECRRKRDKERKAWTERACPDCGSAVEKGHRYCAVCAKRRRDESTRQSDQRRGKRRHRNDDAEATKDAFRARGCVV